MRERMLNTIFVASYIHENRTPVFEGQSIVTVGAELTRLIRRTHYIQVKLLLEVRSHV